MRLYNRARDFVVIVALCIGCDPPTQPPEPVPNAGIVDASDDADTPDADEPDAPACLPVACTDGHWFCEQCVCAGKPCGVLDTWDGGYTEGVCDDKLRCSVPCSSPICPP